MESIVQDGHGFMWLGGSQGLGRFDGIELLVFRHDEKDPSSISHDFILDLERDKNGDLWVATSYGLNRYDPVAQGFIRYLHDPGDASSLSDNYVRTLHVGPKGDLWIGTGRGGINRYDAKSDTFVRLTDHLPKETFSNTQVRCLVEDSAGNVWFGMASYAGLGKFDPKMNRFRYYLTDKKDPNSLVNNDVGRLTVDAEGRLWIGTLGGGISVFNLKTESFTHYIYNPDNEYSIGSNFIRRIVLDSSNNIWVASDGKGLQLYDPSIDGFISFSHDRYDDKTIANNVVTELFEDDAHNIWLAAYISNIDYWPLARLGSTDCLLGSDRRNCLQQQSRRRDANTDLHNTLSPLVFTDFKLFNQSVPIRNKAGKSEFSGRTDGQFMLDRSINYTREVELNYKHLVFSLEYALLDYETSGLTEYAYRLDGFDNDWQYVGSRRSATYTNLDPGRYLFRLKAIQNGQESNELSLAVVVVPPWWWSMYTKLLYLSACLYLFFYFVQWQRQRIRVQRVRARKLEEVSAMRDRFLANTSHELRTPLNGIIGLAESLINGATGELSELTKHNLSMIVISGKRLSNLVNEILDFSNLKENTIRLNCESIDLKSVVELVVTMSIHALRKDDIAIISEVKEGTPFVFADANRVYQIIYNLVNNATKFTEQGKIVVSTLYDDAEVTISVADTGKGIPEEKLEAIFESFEQVEESDRRLYGGAGLGLTVAKSLIDLHGGCVTLKSELGQGSTFSFTLPISQEQQIEPIEATREQFKSIHFPEQVDSIICIDKVAKEDGFDKREHKHILIVDDEPVNRLVLRNYLELEHYHVTQAESGKQALDLLADGKYDQFDLILLDIMMPEMSGYEVCEHIRQYHPAFLLPILFLTAKNQVSDLVNGFNVGANDFLAKPVSKDELVSRVATHLHLSSVYREMQLKLDA